MSLYSERNGSSRSYSSQDLFNAITSELKRWDLYQLLVRQLGGEIYFDDKDEDDGVKSFRISGDLANPEAYFRRQLRKSMNFDFRNARTFIHALPYELEPRSSRGIDLLFDFLEVIYELLATINYNPETKKLIFNKRDGQKVLRDAINPDLALYKTPSTMLANGQIVEVSHKPVLDLVEQVLLIEPDGKLTEATIAPLQSAAANYIARGASLDQKKQAVRDLADALESIRPQVKDNLLTEDERELFKVANQFAIRHNESKQKGNYDSAIWYDWMFHVNLAALLTVIKILKVQQVGK